jgi:NitT/TauT family transport system ATP-binding protein
MTARPGLLRPRSHSCPGHARRTWPSTSEYLAIKNKLRNLINEESLKAMGGELNDGGLAGFDIEVGPQGVGELI